MKCRIFPFLFFLCLIISSVCAAGITLSADHNEYYFSLGESADIPVAIASDFDRSIDGTLQFSTVEQSQTAGMMMTSSNNWMYSHSIPPKNSQITISAGSSDVEKNVRVQVTYDYTDTAPVQVRLPEIIIHFVSKPPPSSSSQSPITSSSAPGSGNSQMTSSVQIVQQSMSIQQQTGQQQTGPQNNVQQAISNNQMPQDIAALKAQLQQESEQKEKNQNEFNQRLAADPLVQQVNATLAADGFIRQSLNANPKGSDEGTFTMSYKNPAGDLVDLQGTMTGGIVPSVLEQSASAINVTAPLSANTTYQSFENDLKGQGFKKNQTLMNVTLSGATVNVTYFSGQGMPAYVNATIDRENVTQVSFGISKSETNYLLIGITAALLIILCVIIWWMYRRMVAQNKILSPVGPLFHPALVELDYKKEALRLLEEAEKSFARGEYQDAYGLAGRAARTFLSYELGVRYELTNAELASVLTASGLATQYISVIALLERCSDVEFAKGQPDAGEFASIIRQIIDMVKK